MGMRVQSMSQNIEWYVVADLPIKQDMTPLLAFIQRQGIIPYVTEERRCQRLWINQADQCVIVSQWVEQWTQGRLMIDDSQKVQKISSSDCAKQLFGKAIGALTQFPVTALTLILSVIGASLIEMSDNVSLAYWLLFQAGSVQRSFLSLEETLALHQYWRLVTPIFLHFGWAHILFNGLILWELGRRIEYAKGHKHLLLILLVSSILSNFIQYMVTPNTYFGGLSGVNYALLGYIAVYQTFIQHPVLQFNKAAVAFLIAWLVLGMLGVINFFMVGSVANGAHIGGLMVGVMWGAIIVLMDKKQENP
ncbi:hypothetical protein AB835_06810 [Candidatus Endobugula sertula]|uniref:Rhomboid family intramembrane serine protease n=1 Tax=Candidatus Endobugula sertula TaxID=62101 RepID=A0A1D2QQI2_9GAMM|nr:hypothetical protein AB835_06810 [Candidatus Endobugula sertula]